MRRTTTESGREFRRWASSESAIEFGSKRPFLLPTARLPTVLMPAIVHRITGTCEDSSASNAL
ncbi:hypothetical protein MHBO_002452 [Bonamia ostreae]|uniref:Uncharacterized protein n=1 Tax=Bonamia ostreae TaxID=126728 RepID=A0ABV2AMD2_9EUKA